MRGDRRVVVTGLGMVSPLGLTVPSTWTPVLAGQSGVAALPESGQYATYPARIAASVKDFDPSRYLSPKDLKKMDVFVQYGLAASDEAIRDAGLLAENGLVSEIYGCRMGAAVGSGIGGLLSIEKNYDQLLSGGPKKVSPFFIPGAIINMVAGQISIKYGLKGPSVSLVTACTTGTHNIGDAARMIVYGDADLMVAGGSEMATTQLGLSGFAACRALSLRNHEPERASRPWDRERDGFVLGDGAGVLVLEEYEHAKKRGAHIYAELVGYGMSSDAYHMTSPDLEGRGALQSMRNALNDAAVGPEVVNYVNAHGTSTPAGDPLEVLALKKCFGEHAYQLAVSSTKSMIGHLLGAAGAVEAIFTVLSLRDQIAPPTINLDDPDEGCDLDFVPHKARPMKIDYAMSNSFGFGGTNGTLLFKRIP